MKQVADQAPTVSVVIPTFDRSSKLLSAIESVRGQTFEDLEIVVVDDASTDDTIVRITQVGDKRIRVLRHQTNQGPGAARNTGLQKARGTFVAFLDSDDHWLPDKLERDISAHVNAAHDRLITYTRTRICGENRERLAPTRAIRVDECVLEYLVTDGFIQTSSICGRSSFLAALAFPVDATHLEDWAFLIEAQQRGAVFRMLPEALVVHDAGGHRRLTSAVPSIDARQWIDERRPHVSRRAAAAFSDSWVAYVDALGGRRVAALFAATRGLLFRRINIRSAGGIIRAAMRPRPPRSTSER